MGYFALVKDGVVTSVIVADQSFINQVGCANLGCDEAIDVSDDEYRPGPGHTYDGNTFSPPG